MIPMIAKIKTKLAVKKYRASENQYSTPEKKQPKINDKINVCKLANLQISVKDDGVGIEKQHIKKIFSEFYKADTSRHHKGSGLGLSICKRIIEKHGGKIWAESDGKGKGTSIIFTVKISQYVKNKKKSKKEEPKEDPNYLKKLERIKKKLKKSKKGDKK